MTPDAQTDPTAPPLARIASEATRIAAELIALMDDETLALKSSPGQAPPGIAELKNRLVAAYEVKLDELCQIAPAALDSEAEAALLAGLKEINRDLQSAARTNAAALRGAIDANRQVLDLVVGAVRQSQTQSSGYGRSGSAPSPARASGRPAMMTTRL